MMSIKNLPSIQFDHDQGFGYISNDMTMEMFKQRKSTHPELRYLQEP